MTHQQALRREIKSAIGNGGAYSKFEIATRMMATDRAEVFREVRAMFNRDIVRAVVINGEMKYFL